MTPIRTKPNVNFLAKTEPIGMGSNFQFPVSYFQTPPLVKPPSSNTSIYVNFNPNSTISYTSYGSPVMPNRGVVEKNHAGFVYEERRPYGYGQSNNGDSYRQGYRGMWRTWYLYTVIGNIFYVVLLYLPLHIIANTLRDDKFIRNSLSKGFLGGSEYYGICNRKDDNAINDIIIKLVMKI